MSMFAQTGTVNFRKYFDHPMLAAAVSLMIYIIICISLLVRHDWDPSRLIIAGDFFVDRSVAPESLHVFNKSYGYDGQFYYRFALDPLTSKRTDFGISVDSPAYRHQRILLPALAFIISGGSADLAIWAILFINVICIGLLGLAGGMLAKSAGLPVIYGSILTLFPGLLLTLARSLTEIVEISFLVMSLALIERRIWIGAAVALSLTILARETSLVAVGCICLVMLTQYRLLLKEPMRWVVITVPILTYISWQAWLHYNWGMAPILSAGGDEFVIPFSTFWQFWYGTFSFKNSHETIQFFECIYLLLFIVLIGKSLLKSPAATHLRLSWAVYGLLGFSLSARVWVVDWSFLRVLSEFGVIGLILLMYVDDRSRKIAYTLTTACWLALSIHVLAVR